MSDYKKIMYTMLNLRLLPLLFLFTLNACGSSATQSTDPVVVASDASISITSPPSDNQAISGSHDLRATVESADNIVQVTFSINDVVIGSDSSQPYTHQWNTLNYSDGVYRLVVLATDSNGNTLSSSPRLINVNNNLAITECTLTPTEQALLDTHNAARAVARQCGDEQFAAVNPLQWNCALASAAQTHSDDMIQNNFFDHDGADGSKPWDRAEDAGYVYRTIGENIAANQTSVNDVMAGWLNSPGHCSNIMNPSFEEIGANRTDATSSEYSVYWTALFGTQL